MALGAEGGQALRGERGDDLTQSGHGPAARRLDLFLVPAPGNPGRRPHQAHRKEVLAQAVVDRVEDLVAGERAPLGQYPLLDQGMVEDPARGPAQQGAVEVDEDGTFRHG